jgi:serine/threonine protein kinase
MRARKSGWKILGAGANGIVFNNGKMVRKFTESENKSEYNVMKKLANSGANYIPKVHELNAGKGYTMYSMNKLPPNTVTLYTYLTLRPQFKSIARTMLRDIVKDMHERGISHGDLHDNNIMVTKDDKGNIKKMWIIDFGRTIEIPIGKTELEAYASLKKTNLPTYGLVYGPSTRYSRPNIKLTGVNLVNFKRVGPKSKLLSPIRETNGKGRLIHMGPRGGLYVIHKGKRIPPAKGQAPLRSPTPKAPTPKAPTPKARRSKFVAGGLNRKGRIIHAGPRGGLYVIINGKKVYNSDN